MKKQITSIRALQFLCAAIVLLGFSMPASADRYRIEIKAWAPFEYVADLHPNYGSYPCIFTHPLAISCNSAFAVDEHAGYVGSYRVVSRTDFDWNGSSMSNFNFHGDNGTTHRVHEYLMWNGWRLDEHTKKQTGGTSGSKTSSSSVNLQINSNNPMIPMSPEINSSINVTFNTDGSVYAEGMTDDFPSHGVGIYRRNSSGDFELVSSCRLRDARGVNNWSVAEVGYALTHQNWHDCSITWGTPEPEPEPEPDPDPIFCSGGYCIE